MATKRFSDLSPQSAATVIDDFLGASENVYFTEKLAGQHLDVFVYPDGKVKAGIKTGGGHETRGYFPVVEGVFENHHPPVSSRTAYSLEVLKRDSRPDFIDYKFEVPFVVADLGGNMPQDVVDKFNEAQDQVKFLSNKDLKKSPASKPTPAERQVLETMKERLLAGEKVSKKDKQVVEKVLMDLLDRGAISSSLGGTRFEGLFGKVGEEEFKVPSAHYATMQLQQARFVAVTKNTQDYGSYKVREMFQAVARDPSSLKGLVKDVVDYLKFLQGPLPTGFKVFFSKEEASKLSEQADKMLAGDELAAAELARQFFDRVKDRKAWVSTGDDIQIESFLRWQLLAGIRKV